MSDERPDHNAVKVHLELKRDRVNLRMLRYFRFELLNLAAYLAITTVLVLSGLQPSWFLTMNVVTALLLACVIVRSVQSYRRGFQDGLSAYPLAMTQPSMNDVVYLLEHSDELWKPDPVEVAHGMEIIRLEREANGGLPGT